MKFSFRLAELLNHLPDPKRRPGTIKAICDYTGLDRHQVSALLKNEAKYVPLHALSQICDYLIKHGYAAADRLPGALFGIEPENFWELLARRRRLELCLSVRASDDAPEGNWVVASDSLLLGRLLNGVSTLGGTASYHREGFDPAVEVKNGLDREYVQSAPQPEDLKQSLVWAPGQKSDQEVQQQATDVYQAFDAVNGDKAIVGIGSCRSNPMVEMIVAGVFRVEPFVAPEGIVKPSQRSVPFFWRFRDQGKHLPTCCHGGIQLVPGQDSVVPGIYYETADGTWKCSAWDEQKKEVAFVFYVYRESQGRLEMVLGGYTGRGTRLLSRTLERRTEEFWPPPYDRHGVKVGAFIVEYSLKDRRPSDDILQTPPVATPRIFPLDEEVIERRMEI